MPRVSVVIPSYNHEKFVGECLQSVLDQTFPDFEIIITDDGSSDDTVARIREFSDPRIRLYTFSENRGACAALNHCIRRSSAEFIAFLSSDEAWEPRKLEIQTAFLDGHPATGAVFSKPVYIDETSQVLTRENIPYYEMFDQPNRSRYEWLNHFFFHFNCLCHPGSLVRRRCYDATGLFNERMASLPDYDMWIRLCLKYEIFILEDRLVRLRIRKGNVNASGPSITNMVRGIFEVKQILNNYLSLSDAGELLRIFPEAEHYNPLETQAIPYVLGQLAASSRERSNRLWGLEVVYRCLENEQTSSFLKQRYGFGMPELHSLIGRTDCFELEDHNWRTERIFELETILKTREQELNDLSAAVCERDSRLNSQAASLEKARIENQALGNFINEKGSKIVSLSASLEQAHTEILDLGNSLLVKNSQISSLAASLEQTRAEIQTLGNTVREKDLQLISQVNTLAENSLHIENLNQALRDNERHVSHLTDMMKEKDRHIHSLEQLLDQIRQGIVYRLLEKYQRFIEKTLCEGSRRRRCYELVRSGIRVILHSG